MASMLSILKTIININHIHVESQEIVSNAISRYGEIFEQKSILVHARPFRRLQGLCPKCGKRCPGYDHKRGTESLWRAPNLNGIPVYIAYCPVRIECPEHGVLTEHIPWADGSSRFTADFNNEVAWLVCQMSKSAIAEYLHINWRTVGNCVEAAHGRLEPDVSSRLRGLRRICVDETSYRKGHSYITVVYDMDRNRVAWIHVDHGQSVFETFCQLLTEEERARIEVVAGDGAKWIDTCTKNYFPNAKRCIDFFHVVEWANKALDKVRMGAAQKAAKEYERRKETFLESDGQAARAAQELAAAKEAAERELASMPRRGRPSRRKKELLAFLASTAQEAVTGDAPKRKGQLTPEHQAVLDAMEAASKALKGAKHALGHNPENCTEGQKAKIELIENSCPDLYRAYQLKEGLRLILHLKDPGHAACELDDWLREAGTSGLAPMAALAGKIGRHKENILRSIECQANSAKSESANTTIKVLIKMARGFRNIGNMMALIYLKCSDIVIPLNNRIQIPTEEAARRRERANQLRENRVVTKQRLACAS